VRGVEQANEYRVWRAWRGSELRLIKRSYEEWMVVSLDGPDLAGRVDGCDAHPMFAGDVLQLGRQPIGAGRVLDGNAVAVEPCEQGARRELNNDCLVLQRTSEQRDDRRPSRAVFSVGGITNPRQSPSVLDQHVLKATSSADERDVALPCFPDDGVSCLRIAVRGARSYDDGRRSRSNPERVANRVGGHDPDFDWNEPIVRSMFQRSDGRAMVPVIGRQIDQDCDDDGVHQ
jgi:hypothetical protein